MKKFLNDAANFVDETVEGIIAAYGDKIQLLNGDRRVIITNYPRKEGKVGIVTAGGSGHLPLFLGYVGQGMVDACAVGNVFASPAYSKMLDAIKFADQGAGVLCLYGNYGGDKMNFNQAIEDAEFEDIRCTSVLGCDDVASAPKGEETKRRGVAGIVYAYKCAGAAAELGKNLDEVTEIAQKVVNNVRTMGVATSPCIAPEVGVPTFSILDDEVEIGMGIHGEKGISIQKMMRADELTDLLVDKILEDMPLTKGDEVSVLINGLGATPLEEQFIIYRRVAQRLNELEVTIYKPHIGEFATSMEMSGFSVSILKLDEEIKTLLDYPAQTPFYTVFNK